MQLLDRASARITSFAPLSASHRSTPGDPAVIEWNSA